MKLISFVCTCALASVILFSSCGPYSNKMDYTFVVAGDCRVAPEDTLSNPTTINTYQLNRMFDEVAHLNPLPKFLIFNGDLVLGYTNNDTVKLANELREWIKIYKASPLAKTDVKVVALPGNHETCEKLGSGKIATVANERVFMREMKDFIIGDNGPRSTGLLPKTDSLMSDQSRLTYSFNYGGDHFVICNTDPVARESRAPYHWLNKDLSEARKEGARHIFLFAHKPAFQSNYPSEPALEENKANRDSLWACLEKYNCDAMFCSHFHLWDTVEPDKGKTWQIVVGNAGAPMVSEWLPYYYGFTIVRVYSKVGITSMGRDADKEHKTAPAPDKPTLIRAMFTIN